jgi:hypothetical protein
MHMFRRGHHVTRNRGTVCLIRCQLVELVSRQHINCTSKIPVTFNETEVFMYPISLVIKAVASLVKCNDVAPPRIG